MKTVQNNKHRRIEGAIPSWMPHELVQKCGGHVRLNFQFSEGERLVLHKRKPEKPSIWTEKHRVLRLSSIPGKWKHIFTPYLAGIMDAARFSGIETVILCKAPQTAGSEAGFNLLGHAADHAPGPSMIVFPDKETAKDNAKERIIPMFEDSPRLRKHLTGSANDETNIKINLRHMSISLGWSGSVSRLGNRPIRNLMLDELDKYQDSRNEASSESLAEHRTTTWRGRRLIIKISTPTTETGPIWLAFTEEAHARFDWWVCCPTCGTLQLMIFDNIRWPEHMREPEEVLQNNAAYYQCAHCDAQWNDNSRDLAVRQGQWIERSSGLELFTHLKTHKLLKIGFHIPAWLSYFVSLSEVANAFLKWNKNQRKKDLKNFMNQYKAEPWADYYSARNEDAILALCNDRIRGRVPGYVDDVPRVAALIAGIDTQASYFRYVIRAFGYGESEESWLIQAGSAPSFEALDALLWKSVYRDADGKEYRVRAAVIDAMGKEGTTKKVYAWCSKRKRAMAYQGKQSLPTPIAYTPLEFFPDTRGSKVKIPGGLLLRRVDTTFFKSDLAEKLSISPGDPGTFWLHSNSILPEYLLTDPLLKEAAAKYKGLLYEYAKEMCAEVFNSETLIWENPKMKPNHFWDCEVMALVGAWELGLRNKRAPGNKKNVSVPRTMPQQKPRYTQGVSVSDRLANALSRRR